jgi:hypothetical protein
MSRLLFQLQVKVCFSMYADSVFFDLNILAYGLLTRAKQSNIDACAVDLLLVLQDPGQESGCGPVLCRASLAASPKRRRTSAASPAVRETEAERRLETFVQHLYFSGNNPQPL